ncbi:MAG: M56 family metallopeptidase, partial [Gemmatimonadaceae bacterium]
MIAAWMLFAIEIGALLFAAAWLAERALLAFRRPVRGIWIAAILGANFLPIVLSQMPVLPLVKNWTLNVAVDSLFAKFGTPLLILWGVAVAIGCFICVSAVWRMSRTRPLWKTEHVDDTPVLVSHDIGPALVGVMQYSIVVPQWAYSLETGARRLLLAHEREHARKYDPLLLAAAALAVVIAPWNVFNWLFFRRLHLAVELDCDQRVLRAYPDAHLYGALLLDVAERVLPSVMPAAAFVEHGASLETRLNAMTEKHTPFRVVRASLGLVASVTLAAAACVMPRPYAIVVVVPTALAQATQTSTQAVEEKMQA